MARMRVFSGTVVLALGLVSLTGGCQWAMPTLNPVAHETPIQPTAAPPGKAQAEPPATEPARPDPISEPPVSGQVAAVQREVQEFVNRFPDTELARKVAASAEPAEPAPAEAANRSGARESASVVRVSAPEKTEATARQASARPPTPPPVIETPAAPSGTVSRVVAPAALPVEPAVIRANAPMSSDRVTRPGALAPAGAPKIEAIEIAPIPAAAPAEPVAPRAEPNRAASAAPAPRVRDIDATIAELQRNVDERPNDFASLFRLRMLQLADGLDDKATSPVAGLDPETGELFADLTRTLVAVRDAVRDPINRSSRAIEQTRQLAQRLRRQAAVSIDKLALVSRVNSYGDYDEIAPAEFPAGQSAHVILYAEISNFRSEKGEGDRYRTLLGETVEVFDAKGQSVFKQTHDRIPDTCRRVRNDFFLALELDLPETLAPGTYTLKATIEDKLSATADQAQIPFTLAAPKRP